MRQKYVYWERYRANNIPARHALWTWDDGNYDSFTHTFDYSRTVHNFRMRWAIDGLSPEGKEDWVKNGPWYAMRYYRTRP